MVWRLALLVFLVVAYTAALVPLPRPTHVAGRRYVCFALLGPLVPLPVSAGDAKLLPNQGTAAQRLALQGKSDKSDPKCSSGVFVNFQQGRCTPVGNVYDALEKSKRPVDQASMDDLEAEFMKKSGIAQSSSAK